MKGQTEKDRAKEGSAVRGAMCDQHFEGRTARASRQREGEGGRWARPGGLSQPWLSGSAKWLGVSAAWEGLRCGQGQPYRTWKGKLGHLDFVLGPAEGST